MAPRTRLAEPPCKGLRPVQRMRLHFAMVTAIRSRRILATSRAPIRIYVGSVQTGNDDGYSRSSERINGPQVVTLDYGSLVPAGSSILTLTLGIATDDFQFPSWGNPFTATINGSVDAGSPRY